VYKRHELQKFPKHYLAILYHYPCQLDIE